MQRHGSIRGNVPRLPSDEQIQLAASADYTGNCFCAHSLRDALQLAIVETFRQSALMQSDFLDATLRRGTHEALRSVSGSSACFSSQPLTTAATKLHLLSLIFLFSLLYFYLAGLHYRRAPLAVWDLADRQIHFTVLALRDAPLLPASAASFQAFGLHLNGCPVVCFNSSFVANNTVDVLVKGPVRASGYFFETTSGPIERDPVRWILEARDGESRSAAWETIGASFMLWNHTAVQEFEPSVPYITPRRRAWLVFIHNDFQGNFPSVYLVPCTLCGICFLFFVLCGAVGMAWRAKQFWMAALAFQVLWGAVSSIHYYLQGEARNSVVSPIFQIPQAFLLLAMLLDERRLILHLALQAVISSTCVAINQHVLMGRNIIFRILRLISRRPVVWFNLLLATLLSADYWLSLRRARRNLDEDARRHEAVWERLVREEGAELAALSDEADRLAEHCVTAASPGAKRGACVRQPTGSLDQLFAQVTPTAAATMLWRGLAWLPAACHMVSGLNECSMCHRAPEQFFHVAFSDLLPFEFLPLLIQLPGPPHHTPSCGTLPCFVSLYAFLSYLFPVLPVRLQGTPFLFDESS